MKIQDSSVQLSASHEANRSQTTEITSEQGFRKVFESLATPRGDEQSIARQRVQKLLQSLIDAILAAMDGKKCAADFAATEVVPSESSASTTTPEITWQRSTTETVRESEKTTVCGKGQVNTCEGRQIAFDFTVEMAREYSNTKTSSEGGTVALRDPLVLSYAGKACELTTERISFDLDSDGKAEQIPGLGAGSAFLVFDRNGNGKADDGSELFGVASGNGFADLAKLDGDHNGWIDEADASFSQLGLWTADGFGSLKQKSVGALFTSAVNAEFSLKTKSNELLGQIRAAGLYLSEVGEVGQMQQVDLAVSDLPAGSEHPEQRQKLAA